jgi:hypothetical protein
MVGMMQKISELNNDLFGATGEQVYDRSNFKGPTLCLWTLLTALRALE